MCVARKNSICAQAVSFSGHIRGLGPEDWFCGTRYPSGSLLGFDSMGRVISSKQTTNGIGYDFAYLYNLTGGLASETYPATNGARRVVTTCYDAVGRIAEVKHKASVSATVETVAANLRDVVDGSGNATTRAYAPHGGIQNLRLGGGVVTETWQYNERLQPSQIQAGLWQASLYYCPSDAASCTTNNGNILKQVGYGSTVWNYGYL